MVDVRVFCLIQYILTVFFGHIHVPDQAAPHLLTVEVLGRDTLQGFGYPVRFDWSVNMCR